MSTLKRVLDLLGKAADRDDGDRPCDTLSPSERHLLELLADATPQALYGLELVKASNGLLKRGSVYVLLGRMEDKGLVVSTERPGLRGVPRKYYRPSPRGLAVLDAHRIAEQVMHIAWATP